MFVALVLQHAMRMRRIVICGPPLYNTLQHYLITVTVLGTNAENKTCVWIFSTFLSETFLILRRNKRDMMKNVPILECEHCLTQLLVV